MGDKLCVKAVVGVDKTFDPKYKKSVPIWMRLRVEKAINASSKLQTKPSSDRNAKHFGIDMSVSLKYASKGIEAEVRFALSEDDKIFATGATKGATEVSNPAKIDDDVKFLAESVADDAGGKAAGTLEKRVK